MKRHLHALLAALAVFHATAPAAETPTGKLSLDTGWRFHQGDIPFPVISGHGASYANAKAGRANGAAAPDFDDTGWRQLDLPHDWAVEGAFDKDANLSQGYRARGFGWYRRSFKLDPSDRGSHFELQFDGIATHATIWVNGTVVHRNWCGYTSSYIDITPLAKYGDALNTISVRVDAVEQEGWWYEGAGIYRHTWLVKRPAVHIVTDGVFAQPVRDANGAWSVPVEVRLGNSDHAVTPVEIASVLLDPEGKTVASGSVRTEAALLDETTAKFTIPVPQKPRLWSVDQPTLYTVRTTLKRGGSDIETVNTPVGFRTIRFDADHGFFLNDQPLKLKGTCNHQDHAGVGVAVPDSIWDFRVRRLKEMGSNAYRCAHNPPAREFLDACDRLGMLVMDENRNFNSSPEYVRQLEWLVKRDRNHPSVILWSVFNEEPMQGTEIGYEMVRRMAAVVKRLDTSRPVTAAMNGGVGAPVNVSQAVDVVGFNYQSNNYDGFHKNNPKMPMTSSEDTSAFMTRGVFGHDPNRADCYDERAASWGLTHRKAWKAIVERPFLAGGFVWTGFDYRGEPQPYSWPSVSSVFGIMDVCGFPKTAFYIHQAAWIDDRPVLQLAPHWNWPGMEGKPVKVLGMTNGDAAELFLNGKSLGKKSFSRYDGGEWTVEYAPGKLSAIAFKDGREIARTAVETTGPAVSIKLIPDRPALSGDGRDAQPITVCAVDADGRAVPTADSPITFEVEGPGSIIGHGNGDNTSHEPEQGNKRSLYNGLAQLIVRGNAGGTGKLTLRASSPGLAAATLAIDVRAVPPVPSVAVVQPLISLEKWRVSPGSATRPDPNQALADSDQNTWAPINAGKLQKLGQEPFVIYRTTFNPYADEQAKGGHIEFKSITGKAEVWIDNKLVATKTTQEKGKLVAPFPAGSSVRSVNVLIEGEPGKPAGLGDEITVGK